MQKKSLNTVEVIFFSLDYEAILKMLRDYARKCIEKGAKTVVLIGSLARGDYTAFSDADIVIISDNVTSKPIDRIKEFIDPTLPIDVEPRVYTTQEILGMAMKKRRIVKEIVSHGKLLAGDKKVLEQLRKLLQS